MTIVQQATAAFSLLAAVGGGVYAVEDRFVTHDEQAAVAEQYAGTIDDLQDNNRDNKLLNAYQFQALRCEQAAHKAEHHPSDVNVKKVQRCEKRLERLEAQLDKLTFEE